MPGVERAEPEDDALARARRGAETLAQRDEVRAVFLFGSAARRGPVPPRDIDLAVIAEPTWTLDERLAAMADLERTVGPGIDLVPVTADNIVLGWEVANTGPCLFARTPDDETDFVVRARARYWDWKPFLETQWRYAGERLAERLAKKRHGSSSDSDID